MKSPVDPRIALASLVALSALVAACSSGHALAPTPSAAFSEHRTGTSACIKGWSNASSPGVPFQVVDESGLTEKDADAFDLYVTVNNSTQYLDPSTGTLKTLTSTSIPPIPVAQMCPDFALPPGVASRAYLSFGPLTVTDSPPNPKSPHDPDNGHLYDWMEFGTPAGSVYNFQADMFGLPLQANMTDSAKNVYAFGYNHYFPIVDAMKADPWKELLVCGKAGTNHSQGCPSGEFIVRVQAPGTASAPGGTGFPPYWTDYDKVDYVTQVVGKEFDTAPSGSIVYVAYQISYPNPNSDPKGVVQGCGNFPSGSSGLPCPGYVASYDAGTQSFVFTLASPVPAEWSPSPDQAFPKTVVLPVKTYFTDYDIWAQPAPAFVPSTPSPGGGTPAPISSLPMKEQVEFYLLKDMYVDLNRGVATTAGTVNDPSYHALLPLCMPTPVSPACTATNYYKADRLNEYAAVLHKNSVNIYDVTKSDPLPDEEPGTAYGFPYDDEWSQSSSVTPAKTVDCLQVRILPMAGEPAKAKEAPLPCYKK